MTRFLTAAAIAGALLTAPAAWAAPEKYVLDSSHSQVLFSYDHLGYSTTWGMFSGFEGEIMFDQDSPANSTVTVSSAYSGSVWTLSSESGSRPVQHVIVTSAYLWRYKSAPVSAWFPEKSVDVSVTGALECSPTVVPWYLVICVPAKLMPPPTPAA